MKKEQFQIEANGRKLEIEINDLAEQASGSCLVRYGDTQVLATCVLSKQEREGINFLPLSVEYQERYYAAGKILGSRYIRRESRPTDEAILTARAIDRTIRPRFSQDIRKEIQVIVTCLSWDRENDPDIPGLLAASVSLLVSDIPWQGPIAACRIGRLEGKFIINPTYEQREKSDIDLMITGVEKDNNILINMIEAESAQVPESVILEAIEFAKPYLKKLIDFQEKIRTQVGKEKLVFKETQDSQLEEKVKSFLKDKLEKAIFQKDKNQRADDIDKIKEELISSIDSESRLRALSVLEKEIERIVHENVIINERRPDNRKPDELRKIECQVGLLPRTHGSGLFCRGKTKGLSILTLGSPGDVKLLEGMETVTKKRFMHHYNFPPYSVGETSPMRGPGRREIGHGMLVEKSLISLIPDIEKFPYTIRIVSEMLSSNGSTSMASISSSSLALMDAGVPIENPAAGIAIGLMKQGDKYKVLTDIQGPEDHYGDMDFKIAGTQKGITAIQLDVKLDGIDKEILREALEKGKEARLKILEEMKKVIASPRENLSPWAPRIFIIQIKPEKIREVIGPGGKIINEIIAECEVSIDIEESGKIFITAEKEEAAKKAVSWIENITREVKVGEVFQGKVKRIMDFGAFVEVLPGQEGLVHISKLSDKRVEKVQDIVKIGDIIPVKVIAIDEQGRINLSLKDAKNERR